MVLSLAAFGQRHKLEEVDAEKPEGKLLQQIMQGNDAAKKAPLMEQFAGQFPKAEQTPWVLEQLQMTYVKANQPDQVIAAGDKLLALDPEDPEAALQCLKAAEAKKDYALIRKYAAVTAANVHKVATSPQPADADAVAAWKQAVDYAKQVDTYTDYAVYRASLEAPDPKTKIDLLEVIQQKDGNSEYAAKGRAQLFMAYRQAGANDKALGLAEKILATDQSEEDMLLVVADNYLQTKKDPEKIHAYSEKAAELATSKPKPEGVSDADWQARKNQIAGYAHYLNGKQYAIESKAAQADQEYRKALPMIEATPGLAAIKPEILFTLGLYSYGQAKSNPEKAQESAHYFRQCAALKSPYQAKAAANLKAIMTEYRGIK
jgi:Tfp pilus assembly protein PilF